MSIQSIDEKVRKQAETKWRSDFEAIINPLRDRLPDCFVEIGGRNYKAFEVFELLTKSVFEAVLPEKQEQAIAHSGG